MPEDDDKLKLKSLDELMAEPDEKPEPATREEAQEPAESTPAAPAAPKPVVRGDTSPEYTKRQQTQPTREEAQAPAKPAVSAGATTPPETRESPGFVTYAPEHSDKPLSKEEAYTAYEAKSGAAYIANAMSSARERLAPVKPLEPSGGRYGVSQAPTREAPVLQAAKAAEGPGGHYGVSQAPTREAPVLQAVPKSPNSAQYQPKREDHASSKKNTPRMASPGIKGHEYVKYNTGQDHSRPEPKARHTAQTPAKPPSRPMPSVPVPPVKPTTTHREAEAMTSGNNDYRGDVSMQSPNLVSRETAAEHTQQPARPAAPAQAKPMSRGTPAAVPGKSGSTPGTASVTPGAAKPSVLERPKMSEPGGKAASVAMGNSSESVVQSGKGNRLTGKATLIMNGSPAGELDLDLRSS